MKKKSELESPIKESIPVETIQTLFDVAKALEEIRKTIEFRLSKNTAERSILERSLFRTQLTIIDLGLVNAIPRE
jgi:hypothetical protein